MWETIEDKPVKVSIILPTYNESENIIPLLRRILDALDSVAGAEVIIVDDSSPDGTAEIVRREFGQDARVRLHVRVGERGLATAIRKGIDLSSGQTIIVMDSDFNHDPKYIQQFLKLIQYYEVVVGSRFLYGGGMESRWRYYASFLYNLFIRFVLGIPIRDKLSGFFAVRREILDRLSFDNIFYGYGDYFIRFLMAMVDLKLSVLEIPVFYDNRPAGESKTMFFKEFMRYTRSVIRIRLSSRASRFKGVAHREPATPAAVKR
ncbi:MAG: glycosyltransferase [Candidatus Abyssobacteria bacterium SURF_5]|uniref:Glycosyltransferase n=1 Tax=Abyssobacteria bacterium (strain SURF_5) TaxID=2093360 RepID=A0A3A4NI41_ABYX5|nr:MAG: glycosyltransferase [Candidatus Abyssubacteria bacterium SURF_5]